LAAAFFLSGTSESDSSFFTPLVFFVEAFAEVVPLDFRFFGFTSSSLSDSSFLAAFFGVGFFGLLSLARISFASLAAFFSIDAFCFASFDVNGSSSSEESSPNAVSLAFGGSLLAFFLARGMSSSESESRAFFEVFCRFAYSSSASETLFRWKLAGAIPGCKWLESGVPMAQHPRHCHSQRLCNSRPSMWNSAPSALRHS
jgi:hypothetical protein